MPMIRVKCAECGRLLECSVLVPGYYSTDDEVEHEAYCNGCKAIRKKWVKVLSGPAANMNGAWQRQCR